MKSLAQSAFLGSLAMIFATAVAAAPAVSPASDKPADSNVEIAKIFTIFNTNDDDKDRGDGISESYMRGNEVLGQDHSWGKDLVFRDHSTDYGKKFDIAQYHIKAREVGSIMYDWSMDNDDGWNVTMTVYVELANGHVYRVGGGYMNIHGGANTGNVHLGW